MRIRIHNTGILNRILIQVFKQIYIKVDWIQNRIRTYLDFSNPNPFKTNTDLKHFLVGRLVMGGGLEER